VGCGWMRHFRGGAGKFSRWGYYVFRVGLATRPATGGEQVTRIINGNPSLRPTHSVIN